MKNILLTFLIFLPWTVSAPPICKPNPQAGQVSIQLAHNGFGMARVEYPDPVVCPVSISVTPRALNAEFEAWQYLAEPIDAYGFSLAVKGQPDALITFMWQAIEYAP